MEMDMEANAWEGFAHTGSSGSSAGQSPTAGPGPQQEGKETAPRLNNNAV